MKKILILLAVILILNGCAGYIGPIGAIPSPPPFTGWSYLQNAQVKVGVNLDQGAVFGYFSQISPVENVINNVLAGRSVQPAMYGNDYGGGQYWNPTQAGDYLGNPSTVVTFTNDGTTIYAKVIPKDWYFNNVDVNGYFEEWITLSGNIVHARYKFTYTGSTTQNADLSKRHEAPACFLSRKFENFYAYEGPSPWTNDPTLGHGDNPPGVCYSAVSTMTQTEDWIAAIDGSGWGVGAYRPNTKFNGVPGVYHRANVCRYEGYPPRNIPDMCVHLSFQTNKVAFHTGDTLEFDVYLVIGSLTEIRTAFYQLRAGGAPPTETTFLISPRGCFKGPPQEIF